MKILANDGISKLGKQLLENEGYTVQTEKVEPQNLIEVINAENYEILLVRSATFVRKDIIDACPNIKLIGRGGVGMDNIDVEYARSKGIKVVNTPDASSQSVAELVIASMFAISRFLNDSYLNMHSKDFSKLKKQYAKGVELRGKTLGIIGFGRIGHALASYAFGLGMNVLAADNKKFNAEIPVKIGTEHEFIVSLPTTTNMDEVLAKSDYISIHVPKRSNKQVVIGREQFAKMKDGVRIVNAARGGVVDEQALLEAIDNGKVTACAMDVYENEPNPNIQLLNHPLIACTPHIGASTIEAQNRIGEELAQIIFKEVPLLVEATI